MGGSKERARKLKRKAGGNASSPSAAAAAGDAAAKPAPPGAASSSAHQNPKRAKAQFVAYLRATLAAPASSFDVGTDFHEALLQTKHYKDVRNVLDKAGKADVSAKHPVNLLDNRGHLLDMMDRVVEPNETSTDRLREVHAHWENMKEANRKNFEQAGVKQAAALKKELALKMKEAARKLREEKLAKRLAKEAPEKAEKEKKVAKKRALHEAREKKICIDFAQGKCPFGAKCNYSHADPDGHLTKLNEEFMAKQEREGTRPKGKRKRPASAKDDTGDLGVDFDLMLDSSSDDDNEEADRRPRKPAKRASQAGAAVKVDPSLGKNARKKLKRTLGSPPDKAAAGKERAGASPGKAGRKGRDTGLGGRGAGKERKKIKKPRRSDGRHTQRALAHKQKTGS